MPKPLRSSAEALLAMINDILDFSKIEAGKLDLEALDFDLREPVDDFADTLALRAHKKGWSCSAASIRMSPTLLRGDPGRLRQILINLAGNAVKFTQTGEVVIRVAARGRGRPRCPAAFLGARHGHRHPQGEARACSSTSSRRWTPRPRASTAAPGLGLAISKQLAELMGGEIGVESDAGKGSTFWFTVRLDKQPAGDRPSRAAPADLNGVRVLVVDDNATNREFLTLCLAAWGMRPAAAVDGPAALPGSPRGSCRE